MGKRVSVLPYFGFILTTIFFLNSCNTQNKKEDRKVFRYNESRNITSPRSSVFSEILKISGP